MLLHVAGVLQKSNTAPLLMFQIEYIEMRFFYVEPNSRNMNEKRYQICGLCENLW
jgi:hypothetical protein